MSKLNRTFAIVVLLSFFQLHRVSAVSKSLEQTYSYPGKQVMYNEFAFKEGNLVHAVCDGTSVEKNCTVVQQRLSDNSVARSCNVTLKVSNPKNVNLTERIAVLAFGQENAILFWGEIGSEGSFHLMKIQMDNCETKDLIMSDTDQSLYHQQISAHKILIYNTTFDMFFDVPSAYVNSQGLKKVRVDEKFNLDIDDVKRSENGTIRFISPIATRSPDNGYVYSTLEKREAIHYNLWLIKPDGTQKLLANHKNQFVGTSAGYDAITTCANSNMYSRTACTQYDENGNVKFNATLDIGDKRAIIRQLVHNTPGGVFLLMTTSLKKPDDEANFYKGPSRCEIVRVNGEGKRVGSIRLKECFETLRIAQTYSIWESADQFCVASISQTPSDIASPADYLDVVVNCFTEDDFMDLFW